MQDPKGILGNVTINKEILVDWEMYTLDLQSSQGWSEAFKNDNTGTASNLLSDVPTFYHGFFSISPDGSPGDTFLKFQNWHKVIYAGMLLDYIFFYAREQRRLVSIVID